MASKNNKQNIPGNGHLARQGNTIESLENRQLLSAALPYVHNGVLQVFGTRHSDSVSISRDSHRAWKLNVNVNGSDFAFSNRTFGRVNVQTAAGHDRVGATHLGFNVNVNGHVIDSGSNGRNGGTTTGNGSGGTSGGTTGNGNNDNGDGPSKKLDINFFPIGVFSQPLSSFSNWKGLGINTVVGYESEGGRVSMSDWSDAAVGKGLYMIRQAASNLSADANQKNLLAWMLGDEPEINNVSSGTNQSIYNQYKAAAPDVPVFANFSGGYALHYQGNWTQATYTPYLAATDWVSNDIYPVTGWGQPTKLDAPAKAVTQLADWSKGKPQFAIIEASDQNLPWVKPGSVASAAQVRAETWDAVIHGAAGIIYFPQKIGGGFSYNNMSTAVASEIKTQSARLQNLSGVLEKGTDATSVSLQLPSGFEGTVKHFDGHDYLMVLNMNPTSEDQSFTLAGTGDTAASVAGENRTVAVNQGTITDHFAAYDVHVYQLQ